MSVTKRVYVEKKKSFAVEAKSLRVALKEQLHLDSLEDVRIINRYDAQGLDDKQFDMAVKKVFSEPAVDDVFFNIDYNHSLAFAVEYPLCFRFLR